MSYEPQTLLAARSYLQSRTGLPAVSLGIVGSRSHTTGYHLGWDRLRLHRGRDDYSIRESRRDADPTDAAMALDIGQFARSGRNLRGLSTWLVTQTKAGAADTRDIREIIYSPDGRVVRRWDRLGIRSTGDDSHLTHTHISYFRDSERRDKLGPFRRYFEGDEMATLQEIRAVVLDALRDVTTQRPSDGEQRPALRLLAWGNEYSRQVREEVRRHTADLAAIKAVVLGKDVVAAVQAELLKLADRERTERQAELADLREELVAQLGADLAGEIAAELGGVATLAQVEAAVGRVLSRVQLVVEPPPGTQ